MLESLAEWTSYPLYYAFDGAPPPPRTGAAHATIYPYGPFPTGADGGSVMLGLQNEREWVNFCDKVLQQPGAGARRALQRQLPSAWRSATALRAIIVEAFAPLTGAAGGRAARGGADRQCARQHDARRLGASAAEGARTLARSRHAGGAVPAMLPPGTWDEGPRMDPVPALGEHTDAILARAGLSTPSGDPRTLRAVGGAC